MSGNTLGSPASSGNGAGSVPPQSAAAHAPLVEAGDAQRALAFLATRFNPDQVVELSALLIGGGRVSYCGRLGEPHERAEMLAFVDRHNGSANLYFGVNPRPLDFAGTDKVAAGTDIPERRCIAFDFDVPEDIDANDGRAIENWRNPIITLLQQLRPSALVFSGGGGVHGHFDIDAVGGTTAVAMTADISEVEEAIGADLVGDLPRIMRLPNTVNLPSPTKAKKGRGRGRAEPLPLNDPLGPKQWVATELLEGLRSIAAQFPRPSGSPRPRRAVRQQAATSTPDPAPSLPLFARAVAALPNGPEFTDYNGYFVRGTFALVGALLGTDFEAEGLELVTEWQSRYGGDPHLDAEKVERAKRETGSGWRHVLAMVGEFDRDAASAISLSHAAEMARANPITEEDLRGAQELADRMAARKHRALDAALAELNERFAHVLDLGAIIEFPLPEDEKGLYRVISRQGFQDHFSERFSVPGPSGKPTTKGLGAIWLTSPKKRKYERVGLWPVGQEPGDALNLFTGLPVRSTLPEAATATGPRVTDCPLWYAFLREIVADRRPDVYEDLLDRNALKIQNPLGKSTVSLVLVGETRIGKSFYAEQVRDIFGKKLARKFADNHRFLGNFNSQLEGLLLVELEEAIFGRDPRFWGPYKDMITSPEMQIEHKGVNAYDAQNCMDFVVCSNYRTSVRVELRDERHTVLRLNPKHQNDRAYFAALREEWINGGREAFIRDMLKRDLKGMRFLTALRTPEKAELSEATADPVTQFWSDTLDAGHGYFLSHFDQTPDWARGKAFMTNDDLLNAYRQHCREIGTRATHTGTGLAREIIDVCPEARERRLTVPKRGGKQVHGVEFPKLAACRAAFQRLLGGG